MVDLVYVAPAEISDEQLARLVACQEAADEDFDKLPAAVLRREIAAGNLKVFTLGPALLSVSCLEANGQRMLVLENFCHGGKGQNLMKSALRAMRRLAKDWNCSHVETRVFSPKVLKFLLLLGCSMDSAILRVEASDGQ